MSAAPSPTLFQRLLGAAFFNLAPSLRQLHGVRGSARYVGVARIERGSGLLARLCALPASLPPAAPEVALVVEFATDAKGETWRRDFGGRPMRSRMRDKQGLLCERLGPMHFRYRLHVSDGALWWQVVGVRLFGVMPLPAGWFDGVCCREREHDDRYEFLVEVRLPLVGLLIRYEGWLAAA